jgi:DNA-binding MarR family transcriptional regulator
VKRLNALFTCDAARIRELSRSGSAMQVHAALQERPVMTPARLTQRTGLTGPTVYSALERLESLGVVRELTGRERGRVFGYDEYLRVLSEGTEPAR